jgi:hypothetical protein
MLNIPCGPGTVSAVSSENGFGLRNWVSDLVVGLYCICRLNIDFQQATGRRVGVKIDIMFEGIEVRLRFDLKLQQRQNFGSVVIGCR